MMTQRKKSRANSVEGDLITTGKDHISELPDEILSTIISRLTLRDAIRTRLLSRRWTKVGASRPNLKFYWQDMYVTNENDQCWEDPSKVCKDKFVKGVNQFLQVCGVTWIVSFMVFFPLGNDYKNEIDEWVKFAIIMGAEQLTLNLCPSNIIQNDKYVFRRELLSQGTVFQGTVSCKLKILELSACILEPDFFNQFSCLKTLSLSYTSLDLHDVQSIFYNCSCLEYLFLCHCSLPIKLSTLGSSRYLTTLRISFCSGLEQLELSALDLLKFNYDGPFLNKFSFIGVPKLEFIFFSVEQERDMQYVFSQLAKDVPNLKKLCVLAVTNLGHCIPENMKPITIFRKVEELTLFLDEDEKFDILKMTFLLRAFPVVRFIELRMDCPEDFEHEENPEPEVYIHKHLKLLAISGLQATRDQINFGIYLLKHAVALERFFIDWEVKCYLKRIARLLGRENILR